MTTASGIPAADKVFTTSIPMRDGTVQTARVSLPTGDGPWPVVLQRFYWANSFHFREYTFHAGGYPTVQQQFRDADGQIGTRFRQDDTDGYDSVEWIARQPWCDGRVVMYGKSAGGITALGAASARPPSLKAITASARTSPAATFRCGTATPTPAGRLRGRRRHGWHTRRSSATGDAPRICDCRSWTAASTGRPAGLVCPERRGSRSAAATRGSMRPSSQKASPRQGEPRQRN